MDQAEGIPWYKQLYIHKPTWNDIISWIIWIPFLIITLWLAIRKCRKDHTKSVINSKKRTGFTPTRKKKYRTNNLKASSSSDVSISSQLDSFNLSSPPLRQQRQTALQTLQKYFGSVKPLQNRYYIIMFNHRKFCFRQIVKIEHHEPPRRPKTSPPAPPPMNLFSIESNPSTPPVRLSPTASSSLVADVIPNRVYDLRDDAPDVGIFFTPGGTYRGDRAKENAAETRV